MALPPPSPEDSVLVTGASSGIGEQIARRLADLGHGVTLVARRAERLEALAAELHRATGVTARVEVCDLADDSERGSLIGRISESDVHISGVVNSAGFGSYGRFDGLPLDREQAMVRLNVLALHELTGAFLWPMVQQGAGAILNVASVAAFQPLPGFATYAATKSFVQIFGESLHAELMGTGVSVTTLSPGPVATEFGEVAGVGRADDMAPAGAAVSAQDVAAAGVRGMLHGKRTVVPGVATKGIALGGRFVPRSLLLPAAKRVAGARLRNPGSA
ncbi:MAG: short-chain dehydrogenase/reductase [Solirubrobacterales bacterium]|nr:short-chain dehydrogenase/reductase [Solirubrobacterales bacterium]